MVKREITKKAAEKFLNAPPAAKGKKRRTEIQHDAELEIKHTAKVAERRSERQETVDTHVPADTLRGVVRETMARVYQEMWPSMIVEFNGHVDVEIQEETYILVNSMMFGSPHVEPRQALKMRELDDFSDAAQYCREHS